MLHIRQLGNTQPAKTTQYFPQPKAKNNHNHPQPINTAQNQPQLPQNSQIHQRFLIQIFHNYFHNLNQARN